MSDTIHASQMKPGVSLWMVAFGVIFILLWIGGAVVIGSLKLMVGMMANESGAGYTDENMSFLGIVMIGQILTGLAGIPAGVAFFARTWRKPLLWTFAILLVGGLLLQILSLKSFFT